ncbi:LysR family transcriptional regulator [Pseudomonas alliivorans]|nr:LysR family transcriptional regulator [Pseudomonas alliivorans]
MPRGYLDDLATFVIIAHERSFTRAAARIGVSPSALSHTVRQLEERVGIRLLARTTRSVKPTEAGERLLDSVTPMLEAINLQIGALSELREKPAGTIRISADEISANWVIWPALQKVLPIYPEISVEVDEDATLKDIVAEGFDAGVRQGGSIAQDMIAVSIGPPLEVCVVGSTKYFSNRLRPTIPDDLKSHNCINYRLASGGIYAWEFEKNSQKMKIRVHGQLVLNSVASVVRACVDGFGLAYVPKHLVLRYLEDGVVHHVMEDWSPPWPGYQLYYPSNQQATAAFNIIKAALTN